MIKGKNFMYGTILYAAAIFALYNRRSAVLTTTEVAAIESIVERARGKGGA